MEDKKNETVLCYLEKDEAFLMLYRNKKQNDMNDGKWIGVGGHIKINETPEDALVREVLEETGYTINQYQKRGIVYFHDTDFSETMHLYTSNDFFGNEIECLEGTLKWIKKQDIFSLNLWEGDKYFLKKMMESNEYFEMSLFYQNGKLVKIEDK